MIVKIPATSANLGPGFDSLGMALNLYNYIEFELLDKPNQLNIEIIGEGVNILSKDSSNLVYQAFTKVFSKLNKTVPGIKFTLKNNIPLARGLGSSAAAIVGGLFIGNYLANFSLSNDDLLELAIEFEGHPDNVVPAFLGGIVISGMKDKNVIYKKITPPEDLCCSVLVPNFHLSTSKAREILPKTISLSDALFNISRTAFFIDAIHTKDLDLLKVAMEDRLHQPYRSKLIPGMDEVFNIAQKIGALGIAISGAGPSLLIFHRKEISNKLCELQKGFELYNIKSKLINLKPISEGVMLLK